MNPHIPSLFHCLCNSQHSLLLPPLLPTLAPLILSVQSTAQTPDQSKSPLAKASRGSAAATGSLRWATGLLKSQPLSGAWASRGPWAVAR